MTRDDLSLSKFFQIFNEMFIIWVKSNIFYYYIPESREYCFKDRFFLLLKMQHPHVSIRISTVYTVYILLASITSASKPVSKQMFYTGMFIPAPSRTPRTVRCNIQEILCALINRMDPSLLPASR